MVGNNGSNKFFNTKTALNYARARCTCVVSIRAPGDHNRLNTAEQVRTYIRARACALVESLAGRCIIQNRVSGRRIDSGRGFVLYLFVTE